MATAITLETGGTVWKLHVKAGDEVSAGQEVFILEVMKMEVPYEAPGAGRVKEVHIAEGDVVTEGQTAIILSSS
jgi:biotin carboxyl carrier protein